MDLGRAGVVELPPEETQRRWQATTPQWPIMHAVTYGVSRDQMMARHKANHIQSPMPIQPTRRIRRCWPRPAMAEAMGMEVSLCGTAGSQLGTHDQRPAGMLRRRGGPRRYHRHPEPSRRSRA
jgi:hypothetical protein